jgi:hypothetical protein
MKKIFKFTLLALFFGFVSCEDATDIIQESELSEGAAYRNVDDLQSGLNGVYAAYSPDAGSNGAGYDAILFNDLFTDNIKRGASNSGQGNQEYGFILQPLSDFPNTIWSNRYATINFANRVLRAWERIAPTVQGQDLIKANQIKGQLLAIRALAHFDLLEYFTPEYQNPSSPSIILMDFVPEITQVFPRSTVGEAYTFIENDLDEASEYLGSFNQGKFFITQDVIKAIRTREALVKGDYALAETLSTELVASHALAGPEEYFNMFKEDAQPAELIFSLSRRQGNNGIAALYYANEPNIDGSPFFEMSNELFNLYDADQDDIRFAVNVHETSEFVGTDSPDNVLLIGKYSGTVDGPTINDIKIFRSSEMQLIKAETQARAGRLAEAAASVRALRIARSQTGTAPSTTYNTLQQALADILLERRKELAFEGHRYLDLKRIGAEAGENVSRNSVDCASFSAPCDLLSTDYRFTLPIPRSEVNANPTIQQNPNY